MEIWTKILDFLQIHKKRLHSPTLVTEELEFSSSDKEIEEKVKKIMDSKKGKDAEKKKKRCWSDGIGPKWAMDSEKGSKMFLLWRIGQIPSK